MAALSVAITPPESYPCVNPGCPNGCHWPSGPRRGRPTRFCSRNCRQAFARTRERLVWELEALEGVLAASSPTVAQSRDLVRAVAHRRWALDRYPAFQPEADEEAQQ